MWKNNRTFGTESLAAREDIGAELKNTVSGLQLQSQLALAEQGLPNHVVQKLRMVEDLAGKLRSQLVAGPSPHQEIQGTSRVRA